MTTSTVAPVTPVPPTGAAPLRVGIHKRPFGTPRVPVFVEDDKRQEGGTNKSHRSSVAQSLVAPPTMPRNGEIQTMRSIEQKITQEYNRAELRSAMLKNIVSRNLRILRQDEITARKNRVRDFYEKQQLIFEKKRDEKTKPPDTEYRAGVADNYDYLKTYNTIFAHNKTMSAMSSNNNRETAINDPDIILPVIPDTVPVTQQSNVIDERSDLPPDPLTDDLVWQTRIKQLNTQNKEISDYNMSSVESEERFKRLQEKVAAQREQQRLYTAGIQAELLLEEYHVTTTAQHLQHRKLIEEQWLDQVRISNKQKLLAESAEHMQSTEDLSLELGLGRTFNEDDYRKRQQAMFFKEELKRQQDSWESLYNKNNIVNNISEKYDPGEETRVWLQGWRDKTDRHHEMITKIQSAWRCHSARCKVRRVRSLHAIHRRALLESEDEREEEYTQLLSNLRWDCRRRGELRQEQACLVLTSFFRRCIAKIQKSQLLTTSTNANTVSQRSHAALRIQSAFRGLLGRRKVYMIRHPDVKLWWHESYLTRFAVVIQKHIRGWSQRRELSIKKRNILIIQRLVRNYLSSATLHRLRMQRDGQTTTTVRHHAANLIQRNARVRLGIQRPDSAKERTNQNNNINEWVSEQVRRSSEGILDLTDFETVEITASDLVFDSDPTFPNNIIETCDPSQNGETPTLNNWIEKHQTHHPVSRQSDFTARADCDDSAFGQPQPEEPASLYTAWIEKQKLHKQEQEQQLATMADDDSECSGFGGSARPVDAELAIVRKLTIDEIVKVDFQSQEAPDDDGEAPAYAAWVERQKLLKQQASEQAPPVDDDSECSGFGGTTRPVDAELPTVRKLSIAEIVKADSEMQEVPSGDDDDAPAYVAWVEKQKLLKQEQEQQLATMADDDSECSGFGGSARPVDAELAIVRKLTIDEIMKVDFQSQEVPDDEGEAPAYAAWVERQKLLKQQASEQAPPVDEGSECSGFGGTMRPVDAELPTVRKLSIAEIVKADSEMQEVQSGDDDDAPAYVAWVEKQKLLKQEQEQQLATMADDDSECSGFGGSARPVDAELAIVRKLTIDEIMKVDFQSQEVPDDEGEAPAYAAWVERQKLLKQASEQAPPVDDDSECSGFGGTTRPVDAELPNVRKLSIAEIVKADSEMQEVPSGDDDDAPAYAAWVEKQKLLKQEREQQLATMADDDSECSGFGGSARPVDAELAIVRKLTIDEIVKVDFQSQEVPDDDGEAPAYAAWVERQKLLKQQASEQAPPVDDDSECSGFGGTTRPVDAELPTVRKLSIAEIVKADSEMQEVPSGDDDDAPAYVAWVEKQKLLKQEREQQLATMADDDSECSGFGGSARPVDAELAIVRKLTIDEIVKVDFQSQEAPDDEGEAPAYAAWVERQKLLKQQASEQAPPVDDDSECSGFGGTTRPVDAELPNVRKLSIAEIVKADSEMQEVQSGDDDDAPAYVAWVEKQKLLKQEQEQQLATMADDDSECSGFGGSARPVDAELAIVRKLTIDEIVKVDFQSQEVPDDDGEAPAYAAWVERQKLLKQQASEQAPPVDDDSECSGFGGTTRPVDAELPTVRKLSIAEIVKADSEMQEVPSGDDDDAPAYVAWVEKQKLLKQEREQQLTTMADDDSECSGFGGSARPVDAELAIVRKLTIDEIVKVDFQSQEAPDDEGEAPAYAAWVERQKLLKQQASEQAPPVDDDSECSGFGGTTRPVDAELPNVRKLSIAEIVKADSEMQEVQSGDDDDAPAYVAWVEKQKLLKQEQEQQLATMADDDSECSGFGGSARPVDAELAIVRKLTIDEIVKVDFQSQEVPDDDGEAPAYAAWVERQKLLKQQASEQAPPVDDDSECSGFGGTMRPVDAELPTVRKLSIAEIVKADSEMQEVPSGDDDDAPAYVAWVEKQKLLKQEREQQLATMADDDSECSGFGGSARPVDAELAIVRKLTIDEIVKVDFQSQEAPDDEGEAPAYAAWVERQKLLKQQASEQAPPVDEGSECSGFGGTTRPVDAELPNVRKLSIAEIVKADSEMQEVPSGDDDDAPAYAAWVEKQKLLKQEQEQQLATMADDNSECSGFGGSARPVDAELAIVRKLTIDEIVKVDFQSQEAPDDEGEAPAYAAWVERQKLLKQQASEQAPPVDDDSECSGFGGTMRPVDAELPNVRKLSIAEIVKADSEMQEVPSGDDDDAPAYVAWVEKQKLLKQEREQQLATMADDDSECSGFGGSARPVDAELAIVRKLTIDEIVKVDFQSQEAPDDEGEAPAYAAWVERQKLLKQQASEQAPPVDDDSECSGFGGTMRPVDAELPNVRKLSIAEIVKADSEMQEVPSGDDDDAPAYVAWVEKQKLLKQEREQQLATMADDDSECSGFGGSARPVDAELAIVRKLIIDEIVKVDFQSQEAPDDEGEAPAYAAWVERQKLLKQQASEQAPPVDEGSECSGFGGTTRPVDAELPTVRKLSIAEIVKADSEMQEVQSGDDDDAPAYVAWVEKQMLLKQEREQQLATMADDDSECSGFGGSARPVDAELAIVRKLTIDEIVKVDFQSQEAPDDEGEAPAYAAWVERQKLLKQQASEQAPPVDEGSECSGFGGTTRPVDAELPTVRKLSIAEIVKADSEMQEVQSGDDDDAPAYVAWVEKQKLLKQEREQQLATMADDNSGFGVGNEWNEHTRRLTVEDISSFDAQGNTQSSKALGWLKSQEEHNKHQTITCDGDQPEASQELCESTDRHQMCDSEIIESRTTTQSGFEPKPPSQPKSKIGYKREITDVLDNPIRNNATSVIQSAFRIPAAKRELESRRKLRKLSDNEQLTLMREREDYHGAAAIQTLWRRHHAGETVRSARQQREAELIRLAFDENSTSIQSFWRGTAARELVRRRKYDQSSRTITRFFRMIISRRNEGVLLRSKERKDAYITVIRTEAATEIQQWWREKKRNKK